MLIKPIGLYEAKDNTDLLTRALRHNIVNPNVAEMLSVLNQGATLDAGIQLRSPLGEAQKEGIGGSLLPDGNYTLLAKIVKVSASRAARTRSASCGRSSTGRRRADHVGEPDHLPREPEGDGGVLRLVPAFGMDNAFFQRQPQPSLAGDRVNIIRTS
jgi:hypothetical protein